MPGRDRSSTVRVIVIVIVALVLLFGAYVAFRASQCGTAQAWSFSRWACLPGPSADSSTTVR